MKQLVLIAFFFTTLSGMAQEKYFLVESNLDSEEAYEKASGSQANCEAERKKSG